MPLISTLLKSKITGGFFPAFVSWMITDRCNMSCPGCGRNNGVSGDSEREVLERLCNWIKKNSIWKISLTGGEPLIHSDIGNIMMKLHAACDKITVNTNGLIITDCMEILRHVNTVCISIDGRNELHDSIRGIGSHDAVIHGIEMLASSKIRTNLQCTISKNFRKGDAEHILEVACEHKSAAIFQPSQLFLLGGDGENPLSPDKDRYMEIIEFLKSEKRKKPELITNSMNGLLHLEKWPLETDIPCGAGRFFCRIDQQGDIFPCSNVLHDGGPAGNINNDCVDRIMAGFGSISCYHCWCAFRVEANLVYHLNPGAVMNFLKLKHVNGVSET